MKNEVFFIGIGGIGMSALARWFMAHNYSVSGSDLLASSTTRELGTEGIKISIGQHKTENLPKNTARVIYNQAIPEDNAELRKARAEGIPCSSYPQSLGELTRIYKTIAIAGAHGKSTTTALVSLILTEAKYDPTVIVGTKLKEFAPPKDGSNFRNGQSEYLIIEADEWKASFLNYFPYAALVTNIDREHLDFYKNLTGVKKAFSQFIYNINPYGLIVLNKDDKNLRILGQKIKRPVVWYGKNDKISTEIEKILKIPGDHNLSNAIGAYTLARALGVPKKSILKSLGKFNGSWRRSELRGEFDGAKIYDDYGHHPTEIRATLEGFKKKYPENRLICVFQPHQRERLKLLFKDFTACFDASDELILLEIYSVAGREENKNKIGSEKLATAVSRRLKREVRIPQSINQLKHSLRAELRVSNKDIVVMMGAGNVNEWTDNLIMKF